MKSILGLNPITKEPVREGLQSALDRPGPAHGRFRKVLRRGLHFLAYHFILKREKTRTVRSAGFSLLIPPTVFHPRFFISSECFAKFIDGLDVTGKCVADVGTGSGILALAAARAGAKIVIAADINANAALAARENARPNGFAGHVVALCCDLLSAIMPQPFFDIILSSPPKHAGEPRDLADAGWHAGADYRSVASLFDLARDRLKPAGRMYVVVSSDSDLDLFGRLISHAGFRAKLVLEHSILIESFIIYELIPSRMITPLSARCSASENNLAPIR
jgi:release factor glutamine methyltransferase